MDANSEPKPKTFVALMRGIEYGKIKIPEFQREFVWSIEKTAKLLDSILKGYSIGAFILWETRAEVDYIKDIGDQELPEVEPGRTASYVLDGQQRIVSLYAAYKGANVPKTGRGKKNYGDQIYVDLSMDIKGHNDEQIITHEQPKKNPKDIITLREILNYTDSDVDESVWKKYRKHKKKINKYYNIFHDRKFSVDVFRTENMDYAIEVFTRINTGGKPLKIFDIMAAKYYQAGQFDMRKRWKKFIKKIRKYGPISNPTILHLLPLIMGKTECRQKDKLDLNKGELIKKNGSWDNAEKLILKSMDYLQGAFKIKASWLLPYDTLLVPLAYFFHINNGKEPKGNQKKYFEEFFWKASLSSRYQSGVETKLAKDARSMEDIKNRKKPVFDYHSAVPNAKYIVSQQFRASASLSKAIMCLLVKNTPESLESGDDVIVDNSWYEKSKRKNYHHFFPKKYLRRHVDTNSLANITLISEDENQSIGADRPLKYVSRFKKTNKKLAKSLKSHFIDLKDFEKKEIKYDKFLLKRAKRIFAELQSRSNSK